MAGAGQHPRASGIRAPVQGRPEAPGEGGAGQQEQGAVMRTTAILSDAVKIRCRAALAVHRIAARRDGRPLSYRLQDLEDLARGASVCHWCPAPVSTAFALDFLVPPSRGGAYRLNNLVVSCLRCH